MPIITPNTNIFNINDQLRDSNASFDFENIKADAAMANDINVKNTGIFGTSLHFISPIAFIIFDIPNDNTTNNNDIPNAVIN